MTHSSSRPPFNRNKRRRTYQRRKVCRFCADKTLSMDFKKPEILKTFTTDRGKMIPRRITGTCAKHQRHLSTAIKQARYMALLPYAAMAGRH